VYRMKYVGSAAASCVAWWLSWPARASHGEVVLTGTRRTGTIGGSDVGYMHVGRRLITGDMSGYLSSPMRKNK
jgi:hypothetical protein